MLGWMYLYVASFELSLDTIDIAGAGVSRLSTRTPHEKEKKTTRGNRNQLLWAHSCWTAANTPPLSTCKELQTVLRS